MNKLNTDGLDNFFSYVSKAVIIAPILILIISLIFRFGRSKPVNIYQGIPPAISVSPTLSIINKIPIDLAGPWVCHYQEGGKQFDLSINNKKIILQVKENNRSKEYNLSSYVPFVEGLLNTDMAAIQKMVDQYSGQKIDINKFFDSCKKGD